MTNKTQSTTQGTAKLFITLGLAVVFFSVGFHISPYNQQKEASQSTSKVTKKASSKYEENLKEVSESSYKEVKEAVDGALEQDVVSTEIAFITAFSDSGRVYYMVTLNPKEDDYSELIPLEENTELGHTKYATISFMKDGSTKVAALYGTPENAFEISRVEATKIFKIIAPMQTLNQLESDKEI